jgi:hypothetical protein
VGRALAVTLTDVDAWAVGQSSRRHSSAAVASSTAASTQPGASSGAGIDTDAKAEVGPACVTEVTTSAPAMGSTSVALRRRRMGGVDAIETVIVRVISRSLSSEGPQMPSDDT